MNLKLLLMIIISVSMSAVAQLMLKTGMSSPRVQEMVLGQSDWLRAALTALSNGHVLLGMGLYVAGAILWLFVLARADLSFAYPFVGLGFILTMIFGMWFLSEHLSAGRIVGTLLIVLGVTLVSRT